MVSVVITTHFCISNLSLSHKLSLDIDCLSLSHYIHALVATADAFRMHNICLPYY